MIRMKIFGTNRARSAARSLTHGVVSVSSTTSETDVATRSTMMTAAVMPWLVRPTAFPCQCHMGTTTLPCVMKLNMAGITMIPVKMGMNSHTRLMKNPSGSPENMARISVTAYIPRSAGACRRNAVAISRASIVKIFTRGSMRWSNPDWFAMSSPNMAWRIRLDAPSSVFSTKLPFFRLPMHPQGHRARSPWTSHLGVAAGSLPVARFMLPHAQSCPGPLDRHGSG